MFLKVSKSNGFSQRQGVSSPVQELKFRYSLDGVSSFELTLTSERLDRKDMALMGKYMDLLFGVIRNNGGVGPKVDIDDIIRGIMDDAED